jgi:RHS repeat-associated protein
MRLRNQLDWDRDGAVMEADGAAFAADLASHVGERFDARETLGNLPLYAGAWWDAWLEVYHVRHRVLDPKEGRWLQRDPIGYAGGSNLYAYVGNQPGRYVDPLGLRWLAAGGGGAGQPAGDGGATELCPEGEEEEEGWLDRVLRDLFMGSGSSKLGEEVRRTQQALLDERPLNSADASLSVGIPYVVAFRAAAGKASTLAIEAVLELALGGTLSGAKGALKTADQLVELLDSLKSPGTFTPNVVRVADLLKQGGVGDDKSLLVGTYSAMSKALSKTGQQANHLNPQAAFGKVIDYERGLTVPLKGSVTEVGSEHRKFHEVLEAFWEQYRTQPTAAPPVVADYTEALSNALIATGRYSSEQAEVLVEAAKVELAAVRSPAYPQGLGPMAPVPRVPHRIPGIPRPPVCDSTKGTS